MTPSRFLYFKPLVPSLLNTARFTKILISIQEGILKKCPMSVAPMIVGRRKEPISSYVTKNDEEKNPGTNELEFSFSTVEK